LRPVPRRTPGRRRASALAAAVAARTTAAVPFRRPSQPRHHPAASRRLPARLALEVHGRPPRYAVTISRIAVIRPVASVLPVVSFPTKPKRTNCFALVSVVMSVKDVWLL